MYLRRFFIRLTSWEYWPFHVVYGPIYLYWIWIGIKARSFFFFNTSNPSIRYGGFLMESKKEIYELLPKGTYPDTVFCTPGQPFNEIMDEVRNIKLTFPVIAKPDIGLRGMAVALINSLEELEQYHKTNHVEYMVQQYIAYAHEVGLFYYRFPGQAKGCISGIAGKQFLKVSGDGKKTIMDQLLKEDRFVLQLETLKEKYGNELNEVLPEGEERLLVPFGNHCRGAKFIDISDQCNDNLRETMDNLCTNIPGFYFGRLDIKYNSWEDFCNGKNFSIIELNGAGSEPAHIYDPRHSIWYGWKVIIQHWNVLYQISKLNKERENLSYLTWKEGRAMLKANGEQVKMIS